MVAQFEIFEKFSLTFAHTTPSVLSFATENGSIIGLNSLLIVSDLNFRRL